MSDITEGLGTAIEGGLFAKAVEDEKGLTKLDRGHFDEQQCLNCGTELIGSHCHSCGQKAHLHRTIGAFLKDLLHGALHLDGKTWRTLPMLAFKPGKLTQRYIEGERARFVSPMALFLFSIFLMFAIFQLAGISTPTDFGDQPIGTEELQEVGEQTRGDIETRRAMLEEELDGLPAESEQRTEIENELADLDEAEGLLGEAESFVFFESEDESIQTSGEGTGVAFIDAGIDKWRSNPGLMLYKLQANFYKFSWLLIPLSTPFVWLLFFWKRRYKAYDHAIFVTYSLAFVSLLFIFLVVGAMIGLPAALLIPLGILAPPIHIYKQLRHAYSLSRFGAIWRLALLLVFIVVVLLLFLQLLVLLGLMG